MKLNLKKDQALLINKILPQIDLDSDLTDDELILMEDELGNYLTLHCLDADYEPNYEGVLCEEILEILGNIPADA